MRYLLRNIVSGNVHEIEITEKEYSDYKKAINILSNALAIEEKYEIVVTNYLDFEKQIFDATSSYMIRDHLDYSDFFEVRLGLNIRLVNLLTAVRLYVDQLNQNVRDCVPSDPSAKDLVKSMLSKEYDGNREYRFMEALRNYVQHRGLPIHWTQQSLRRTSLETDGFLEYSMELASQRSYLEEDSRFKKEVLEELEERMDLKLTTRCYVESISYVHESVRSLIYESVTSAREMIEGAHRQYTSMHNGSLVGLSACAWDDERQVSSVALLLDWDDIRGKLQKRNRKLTNLRKRYVKG